MMPGRAWGADSIADEGIIAGNLPGVLNAIKRSAQARERPRVALAHGWHRDIHAKVASVPASDDLGAPRGSKHPDLEAYEVAIRDSGGRTLGEGTPARQVSGELRSFERSLRWAVGKLDKQIPPGQKSADESLESWRTGWPSGTDCRHSSDARISTRRRQLAVRRLGRRRRPARARAISPRRGPPRCPCR